MELKELKEYKHLSPNELEMMRLRYEMIDLCKEKNIKAIEEYAKIDIYFLPLNKFQIFKLNIKNKIIKTLYKIIKTLYKIIKTLEEI